MNKYELTVEDTGEEEEPSYIYINTNPMENLSDTSNGSPLDNFLDSD